MAKTWVSVSAEPKRPSKYIKKIPRNERETIPSVILKLTDLSKVMEEEIPVDINIIYSDDYDILKIHNIMLNKFKQEKKELNVLIQQRDEINEKLKEQLRVVDRKKLLGISTNLSSKIDEIQNDIRRDTYIEETAQLLDDYKKLGPLIKTKTFGQDDRTEIDTDQEFRISIIKKYLDIAGKYFKMNVSRIIANTTVCPLCGSELTFHNPADCAVESCEECGFERLNLFDNSINFKYNADTSSLSKYEDKENFLKALECYLGEQNQPPASLFEALDRWSESYGHPSREQITNLPLNPDGTRGEYGKWMLLQALSDTGYGDYYKDIRLIGHLYWNWRLPVLSQQDREIILNDYDRTQEIYDNLPKDKGKSSLNSQYRLYRHLEARGHPVNATDFKIPITPETLEQADKSWRKMIKAIPGAVFRSLK